MLDHVSVGSCDTVVTLLENAGQYQQIELEVMTLVRMMGDELKRALDQLNIPCPHISIPCSSQYTAQGQHVQYVGEQVIGEL